MPHYGATCVSLSRHFALSDRRLNGSLAVPLSDPTMLQISHLISVTGTTRVAHLCTQYKRCDAVCFVAIYDLLCDAVVDAVKTTM